ncbi:MAG: BON domain-containing protein [Pirellulaceae bacterium]|nr:BON domain-containing protein [Pirellulaceae bacterium]
MRSLLLGLVVAVATLIPNLAAADDQEIARHIMSKLQVEQQRGALKGFHVDMRVDKGTVWYQGFVSNQEQKDLILSTAQKAKHLGVVQIVDDITIQVASETPVASETQQVGFTEPADNPSTQQANVQQAVAPVSSRIQPVAAPIVPTQQLTQELAPTQPLPFAAAQAPIQTAPMQNAPMRGNPMQMGMQGPPMQGNPMQMGMQGPPMQGNPMQFAGARTPAPNMAPGQPMPLNRGAGGGMPVSGDAASLPNYAWPSYAASPNYAAVTYPGQYSASAWPYIGPFYPYPQVPLGWRKVCLEWDDGWWWLDFQNR